MADDELVEQEPEQYNCETCEVAGRMAALDPDNREAWGLYRQCCNRFLVDLQAGGLLLARLTAEDDPETFADRCERLRILYNVLEPPKTKS